MAPMDVANSFVPLLQVFTSVMTAPTAATFRTLVAGWLLAPQRTILGMVRACGTDRHHAAFHRVFASARWSVDQAGLAVFRMITADMKDIFLAVDDTLLPRFGLKIFGAGMHRDPVLSSRGHTVTRWGHCWVVLCVVMESRHIPGRQFALPVLCRLWLNKAAAEKWQRKYVSKNELMLQMLGQLDQQAAKSGKTLHLLGDSAFTAPAILNQMPSSLAVTGRVGSNVRMNEPPPQRRSGTPGRPRKRGPALPKPEDLLRQGKLRRMKVRLYDDSEYYVRVAVQTGRFYKAPNRDVLVIVVEHLRGGRGIEVFYTTDVDADLETVLQRYSWRWAIEITFQDSKSHLGVGEPQNRTRRAARRTAATGFLLYSLTVWWHETRCDDPVPPVRWWSGKHQPSFADMLVALRYETLQNTRQTYFSTPAIPAGVKKFIDQLTHLLALAA